MKKLFLAILMVGVLVPTMFLLLCVSGLLRITTRFGFGFVAQRKITELAQRIALIRVTEIMAYQYPIPPSYLEGGHIRFTAIRTANIRNEPLDPATQEAMLFIAKVNLIDRLLSPNAISVAQLQNALTYRRFSTDRVYVYKPGEVSKFSNVIYLQTATKKEAP